MLDDTKKFIVKNWKPLVGGTLAIGVFALGVFTLLGGINRGGPTTPAPTDFLISRDNAGNISGEIVILLRESTNNLEAISDADRAGSYNQGLDLALQEINRNATIRAKAVDLSEEFRLMALSLDEIRPEEAAKIGIQAITSGSELVQRLVNYNNLTYELLGAIQERLEKNGGQAKRERIEGLIQSMNKEAEAVNDLNGKYNALMTQFDEAIK